MSANEQWASATRTSDSRETRHGHDASSPEKSQHESGTGQNTKGSSNILDRMRHEFSRDDLDERDLAQQELRPVPRHYFFQRPRALQYTYRGERIVYGEDAAPIQHEISGASADIRYTAEGVAKARERVDLFIDLVWVGIISNLSEVFSAVYYEESNEAGEAFLLFIVTFLPAWRIWNFLREFLNSFYMDDSLQRLFIFWILVLSVYFGNQLAYFAEDYDHVKITLIIIYIIIRNSFVFMEIFYSFWIPWIRKLILVNVLLATPATGLWIAAIFADGPKALGPALAAIMVEYLAPLILETRLGPKMLPHDYRKDVDPIHLRGRMGNFLIITIGEGVLMLVRGGPLGESFSDVRALAVWALLIYFLLAYLYFYRDGSVRFVPAVRRRGWRIVLWIALHIPIFGAFITLSSGFLWFIHRDAGATPQSAEGGEDAHLSEEQLPVLQYRALWNVGTSLAIILACFTGVALADRPLDPPKATLIGNRYLRLLARPIYIIIVMTVITAKDGMDAYLYFGICGVGMILVLLWEMIGSMERPAKVFEPKGLTVLMKQEYRQDRPTDDAGTSPLHIPI